MDLCANKGLFDFGDPCVRASWGALALANLILSFCILSIPIPVSVGKLFQPISGYFRTYLTLDEAEALNDQGLFATEKILEDDTDQIGHMVHACPSIPRCHILAFVFVGLVETLSWLTLSFYLLYDDASKWWRVFSVFSYAVAWLYTAIRFIAFTTATTPFDATIVYALLLSAGSLELGGYFYDYRAYDIPLPDHLILAAIIINLVAAIGMLAIVARLPLAIPSESVRKEDIGRTITNEDYATLFGWITCSWVYPLICKGRNQTLNEDDVWELSPTLQSRPVFIKFNQTKRPSLLRSLWAANSFDLIVNSSLALLSVVLKFSRPFFLNLILQEIDSKNISRASRNKAYIYAFLAFFCTLARAGTDVQHMWFGNRAYTRIRSELMASVYEKSLKRKDYSGIIGKQKSSKEEEGNLVDGGNSKKKTKAEKKAEKEQAAKADDPTAGAGIGKIVNLIASDVMTVSLVAQTLDDLYTIPLDLAIGGVFLYQLMGWSAFSGFLVLLFFWPLSKYLTARSVRIRKGLSAAKDKRMGVLNELISAVKFIKFFAWEDRWIDRILDARQNELKWIVKSRYNSIILFLLWSCAPSLVSITSFLVYVTLGNELNISTAFTAIALFNMVEGPINVIPWKIISILQAGVAMKRISIYLDEEEVSDQVSSLKKAPSPQRSTDHDPETGLGFCDASFRWNEVPEAKEDDNGKGKNVTNGKAKQPSPASTIVDGTAPTVANGASDVGSISTDLVGSEEDLRFELKDLNIRFPEGELTLITGPTASGKTAMLMALLGEMTTTSGSIMMHKDSSHIDEHGFIHSISYAAQSPWLRHQSIKDNILFGNSLDEERYNAVIEACALKPDLEILEDGDQTEIGARGVNLSGGQKARVALARAVYTRTKYVLLDDPLSAVDSHTSRFLYEHLFLGPLLANRTVILVTHHVELVLPGAHYLVRMLDGRIDTHGTVKDLRAKGILASITHDAKTEAQDEQFSLTGGQAVEADSTETQADATKKPRKLVEAEHRELGGVDWSIYNVYLRASSYWTWAILGMLIVAEELLGIGSKFWIKIWGEAYGSTKDFQNFTQFGLKSSNAINYEIPLQGHPAHHSYQTFPGVFTLRSSSFNWRDATTHPYFYVGIYAAIDLGITFTNLTSVIVQWTGALRASRILFKRLLVTVVRATFRFHDTTPQGRILNRFGQDMETIDFGLTSSLQAVNSSLTGLFAAVITVGLVFPQFLIPAFFIGFAYYQLAVGYLKTGRDLRRMESNSRSPIYSDLNELLEGIITVRAFSAENRFLNNFHRKIDATTKMSYTFWITNRWLLLNFEALGGLAFLATSLFSIATLTDGAGWAGVSMTSTMSFTMSVYVTCRYWTFLELNLNSVERVVEYLDLPQEPPAVVEANRVPAYWPSSNNNDFLVSVENLTVKYAPELPAVLHNVSFNLKAGERVGLLGRTGSGKSTLAMSILRFVDPAEGKIIIDGIDISTIGIQDLRSRITFIPQDATLFSGTLRDNLDPFNDHTDAECLDVLQRAQMIGKSPDSRASQAQSPITSPSGTRTPSVLNVPILPSVDNANSIFTTTSSPTEVDNGKDRITLDTQVAPGGANFSQGQRQLIAMARALLRRSSIIVLDEATSSIDFAVDAKIQQTIREEFRESLLLTVAHRLNTIIDYDRLVVLDKGQIAEIGTPWELIQNGDGIFRNMCLKSGSFTELEAIAKLKAEGHTN